MCSINAANPPTHSPAASRCSTKLLVARSCDPPADECPVTARGIRLATADTSSNGVDRCRRTIRHPRPTIAARAAVHNHATATSISPTTRRNGSGSANTALKGWPEVSDNDNGTSARAHPAHSAAAAPAVRTARYPSTSSTPERCGGTNTAASSNDPTIITADTSPTALTAGTAYLVRAPGSGNPSNRNTAVLDTAASAVATTAAPAVQPSIAPTTALLPMPAT